MMSPFLYAAKFGHFPAKPATASAFFLAISGVQCCVSEPVRTPQSLRATRAEQCPCRSSVRPYDGDLRRERERECECWSARGLE